MFLQPNQIDFDQLPVSLREMTETIGLMASLALVEQFRGITLEIPKRINDKHYLVTTLGKETALCFCQVYGGERLYIPKAAYALRQLRNREIILGYDRGESIKELVRKYSLCDRQIWNILKEPLPMTGKMKQKSLFDASV